MWKKEIRKYLVPASVCGFALAMGIQPLQAAEVDQFNIYQETDEAGSFDGVDINDIYEEDAGTAVETQEVELSDSGDEVAIDSMTGVPNGYDDVEARNTNPYITNSCYYDTTSERFVYTVGTNSNAVVANVADGMITSMPVAIAVDSSFTYTLYRNGNPVEDGVDISNVENSGAYTLEVTNGNVRVSPLRFEIVGEYTNQEIYQMPEGFYISSVTLDGGTTEFESNEVSLAEEGYYEIDYACPVAGTSYSLHVKVDHTPPVLELEELNDKFEANGPVDISEIEAEEGFRIRILYEGEEMAYARVLNAPGAYEVTVQDAAGNRSTYGFIIKMYLNISSIMFIALFILAIAGVGVYMVFAKKKLKVR